MLCFLRCFCFRSLLSYVRLRIRRLSIHFTHRDSVECKINCMLYYDRLLCAVNMQGALNNERFYIVQNLALQLLHFFDSYASNNFFVKTSAEMVILSTLERFHFLSSSWGIVSGLQLLIHKCSIEGLPGTDMSFFSDPNITELKIYAAIISLYILAFGGKAETIYKKGLQKTTNASCSNAQIFIPNDSALCVAVSQYYEQHCSVKA